ncbi:amino acid ABC transporter substrate-binding protein [Paraburkholderia hospita]|jgi:general L-amino acid transport system substrate-binding protein|uniref:Amino acid ABC transporter substrate-binding protein n=1 Tax=Paraburkholderia hospita TaxID=169430 RepID=A0AAN1JEG4_9BURK|nr:amino acid ABC transporter substrate-binding protein [Paraburkholderia hospita]AUT71387.1 amino acid ABC transporter substrate-binding protein [Paraburkholderia hospita]OUL68523.1 ABC transporter substrate-binding protein [Paraburkholderia hospita]SEI02526.1 general L-amino acid transport system substrate-binding protein [Paraburkholderia hospita]
MVRLAQCGAAVLAVCLVLVAVSTSACAADGDTLAQVRARGVVRCGVSEGVQGFSIKDRSGLWSGIDVDFCRAVAAAALGDPSKVAYVPLRASARFPALMEGMIDLLARNTTWTLRREAALKVQFAGVLFYDTQGFLVRRPGGIQTAAELKGATVCVEKETSTLVHLRDYSADNRLEIMPLEIDSAIEARRAFFAGRCSAYAADSAQLAAVRIEAPDGPQSVQILPERIAKEPLSPAVRGGDQSWLTLVRWVLFALVAAEELGVTRDNLQSRLSEAAIRRALADGDESDRSLGVERGWRVRAVQSVGNYGEMFDRNLGPRTSLKLDRGLNRLWTQGGLMYAPPFR